MNDETSIQVTLARLEGKLDVSLATHGSEIGQLKEGDADKEKRIRVLESRSTVTVAQLWAGLIGVVTVATGLTTFIKNVFP